MLRTQGASEAGGERPGTPTARVALWDLGETKTLELAWAPCCPGARRPLLKSPVLQDTDTEENSGSAPVPCCWHFGMGFGPQSTSRFVCLGTQAPMGPWEPRGERALEQDTAMKATCSHPETEARRSAVVFAGSPRETRTRSRRTPTAFPASAPEHRRTAHLHLS